VVARRKSLDRWPRDESSTDDYAKMPTSAAGRKLFSCGDLAQPRATSAAVVRCTCFAAAGHEILALLACDNGTKHDALSRVPHLELHTGKLMTDPSATAEQPQEILHVDLGMSIGVAATISIVSIVLVAGSTYAVVKGTLSAGMTRLLAVVALLSLVAMAYGLIELALAVVATTAERRRRAREVTERRQGDRARKPKL